LVAEGGTPESKKVELIPSLIKLKLGVTATCEVCEEGKDVMNIVPGFTEVFW